MTRRKWERSHLWKKIASGLLSVALIMSLIPVEHVQALGERGNLNEIKEWAEKYQEGLNSTEVESGINPIKDGIDITLEEEVSIIVEFNSLPKIMASELNNGINKKTIESSIQIEHSTFDKFLNTMTNAKALLYTVDHSYYDTFNGVALKIKGTDIPKLLDSGVVKSIWNDEIATIEPSVQENKSAKSSSSRMATSTPLVGVDKLREEGITGKGIKVGVLDTGIDYNHPDLKNNYKGGYDFVDNDNDPMETTYEDWQKSGEVEVDGYGNSYYTSHGTHVSGTIAATGENSESEFSVTGLAPEADLYVYRVLGPRGVGSTSDIIAAIEQAVKDGMDVINMSLGIQTSNPLYPSSIACNNAAIAGTIPVVANGNAGPDLSTLGSPGTSALAISVGASTTDIELERFNITLSDGTSVGGNLLSRNFASLDEFVNNDYEIVYGGYGFEYDYNNIDVKGKVVLLERGNLSFNDKFKYATEAGALGLIVANNIPGEEPTMYLGESSNKVPGVSVTMEDGLLLKNAITTSEKNVKFEITGKTITIADKLADFSSRGPSSDETIKPDVVAPGVGIFSTYPEYINSPEDGIDYSTAYSRIDGTSMASPHVAGIVALILQNNKDLTPEEVKVNLMNTTEDLAEDYAINAVGAGRVNAYEAVHNDISISVLDKCSSYDEYYNKIELDYITGSLSYDRIGKSEKDISKSLDLQIRNKGTENKKFNVSVEFLGENVLAENAEANGVTLDIPSEVTVSSGETKDISASINIPSNSDLGRYEGYVIFRNVENDSEDYKLPFSVNYLTPGVESLEISRPAMSNDLEMMHFAKIPGISATIKISSPISKIDIYVKDYETKENIGYVREIDLSYLPAGYSDSFAILDSRASYFPIKEDGELDYVRSALRDGKYTIECIAYDEETGKEYTYNYDILIDNEYVKLEMEKGPGVYELTEDMFTVEEFLGQDYEAFWIKGNATDNSTEALREMGYNADGTSIQMAGFTNGMPRFSLPVDAEGNFKFGIEMSDIESDVLEFSPMPIDIATSQNLFLPPRYFFVKEGTPYTSVTLDREEMKEGENITSTIKVNNVKDGSNFAAVLNYYRSFELVDITLNKDLKDIIDNNEYSVNINKEIVGSTNRQLYITLDIVDKDGNAVNISGDISLVDVELELVSDDECEFYKEYIECYSMDVKDKDGNKSNMAYKATYEGVSIKQNSSTIRVPQLGQGFLESISMKSYTPELNQYIWVEDEEGKKYDLTFDIESSEYICSDIPVTAKELKVVSNLPGHFKKSAKFIPSRVLDGELVGKLYMIAGSEFYRFLAAGDTNQDGVVDIHDALEVEKYYGQNVDYRENPVDFNFDGVVNAYDMDYIVANFTADNEQSEVKKQPELTFNDRTLDNILESTGYSNEIRLESIEINKTISSLEVGKTDQLSVSIKPDNIPNMGIVWTSQNEKVASVDENGLVTALNPGSTYVIARTTDGKLTVSCLVQVLKDGTIPRIDRVVIENNKLDIKVGEENELKFSVEPTGILTNSVQYISSADSVISIVDGKAVAKKTGKAIVTVLVNGGIARGTWEINVTEKDEEVIVEKVEKLKAIATSNSVKLTWNEPDSKVGLTGYVIYKDGKEIKEISAENEEYAVENLKSNTIYGFKVVSKYSNGEKSKPVSVNIRTKK